MRPAPLDTPAVAASREPGTAFAVIDDDTPFIDADHHFRDTLGIQGPLRELFQPPGQVVAEVTDGAAAERQASVGWPGPAQRRLDQGEGILGRQPDVGALANLGQAPAGDQGGDGVGGDDVVAALAAVREAAVQEDRPGPIGPGQEQGRAVLEIGQLLKSCRHRTSARQSCRARGAVV